MLLLTNRYIYLCIFTFSLLHYNIGQDSYRELFDDFNYESGTDAALSEINNWSVVDGISGPPANAMYSVGNIEFVDDSVITNNRLLKVSTIVDTENSIVSHARIETADFSYRHGTFAARVYFDDTPAIYSDGNVETFYTISSYATCTQAEKYSECDFEYLPWDSWNPSRNNNLYFTSWETCEQKTSDNSAKSYSGWHILVYSSAPDEPVKYYIDGELFATHNENTPDSDANISFANWIFNNTTGNSSEKRKTSMLVDWAYHAKDTIILTDDLVSRVETLRNNGILRKNIAGDFITSTKETKQNSGFNTDKIIVYPNPSDDIFTIELESAPDNQFFLVSTDGNTVDTPMNQEYSNGKYRLTVSSEKLLSGMYILYTKTRYSINYCKLFVIK